MEEKELYQFWKEHIDSKYIYRIVSEDYIFQIEKNGFEPDKNPFDKIKPQLFRLFEIIMTLKEKGFIMMRWWGAPVDQEVVINCTKKDLDKNYIDFTPNYKDIINYYLNLKGGALVQTILIFTTELLMKKPPLTKEELSLIKTLNDWAKRKANKKNKVIWLKASSSYFENVYFQRSGIKEYLESPLGSFENFKRVIEKNGLDIYLSYLTLEKLFYLRTENRIPPSEIIKITRKQNGTKTKKQN